MIDIHRIRIATLVFIAVMTLVVSSAFAQTTTDFSGEWGNRNHEDAWDRIGGPCPSVQCGGPAPGDYLGLALNPAGRMRDLPFLTLGNSDACRSKTNAFKLQGHVSRLSAVRVSMASQPSGHTMFTEYS
jgi:hypothetical protein